MFVLRLLYIFLFISFVVEKSVSSADIDGDNGDVDGDNVDAEGSESADADPKKSPEPLSGKKRKKPDTYQSLIENLGNNGWLKQDDSLETRRRLEQVKETQTSSSKTPYVPMPSLYDKWVEKMTSYPKWIEVLTNYPQWNHTKFTQGYPGWKLSTTDPTGIALALAEGKTRIANPDSFDEYVATLDKRVVHPEAALQSKDEPLIKKRKKGDKSAAASSIRDLSNDANPLMIAYILLQKGVDVWETKATISKLKGMCYILAAKAHIAIAKADSLGYDQKITESVKDSTKAALEAAKQADGTTDPKALSDLYQTIVSSQARVIKTIGSASYNPKTAKHSVNRNVSLLIMDVDQKISSIVAKITQTLADSSSATQLSSLKDAVRKIQLTQQGIEAQNQADATKKPEDEKTAKKTAKKPLKKKPKLSKADDEEDDDSSDDDEDE